MLRARLRLTQAAILLTGVGASYPLWRWVGSRNESLPWFLLSLAPFIVAFDISWRLGHRATRGARPKEVTQDG